MPSRCAHLLLCAALLGCSVIDSSHGSALGVTQSESKPSEASSQLSLWPAWNALRGDAYALDDVDRFLEDGERLVCDRSKLVRYARTRLKYAGSVLIDPSFKERLERFEEVAAETAREIYGREPSRVRHYGAFNCRPTRNRSYRISEHALGNALDLVGFDFAPATKKTPLPAGTPAGLKRGFEVRVGRDWGLDSGPRAIHARFLETLTARLKERDDIFRAMFGPGHGGHDDHLHLDVSPWRYVDL